MAKLDSNSIAKINELVGKINAGTSALGAKNNREYVQLPTLAMPGKENVNTAAGNTPAVTSSASVMNERNKKDARNQAGNALTSTPGSGISSPYGAMVQQGNAYGNLMFENQRDRQADNQNMLTAVDMRFDAALARQNQQYNSAVSDLRESLNKDVSAAAQQAAALNPYSEAQGAMTARNFTGAIQDRYAKQENRLREAAQVAQQELEAGRFEAYQNIQNSMNESQRQFNEGMQKFMLDMSAQANQQFQWQQEFGLRQKSFNLQEAQAFEGNFYNFIETFGSDPAFDTAVNQYFETGELNEAVMPLIERGIKIGLSPDEAMSVAQYETENQKKTRISQEQFQQQMGLQWYNAETSRMNAVRQQAAANAKTDEEVNTRIKAYEDMSTVEREAKRALDKLNNNMFNSGLIGQFSRGIESLPAGELDGIYTTIRTNLGFDTLAAMRQESPTGGALGNVTEREGMWLQSTEANLSTGKSRSEQMYQIHAVLAYKYNTDLQFQLDEQVLSGNMTVDEAYDRYMTQRHTPETMPQVLEQERARMNMGDISGGQTSTPGVYTSSYGNTFNIPN